MAHDTSPGSDEAGAREAERLAALHRTGILDTRPEQDFDDLVHVTADILSMPMAAIHLVDATRQWGKAELGLGTREMPREIAFCPHAMVLPDGLVVPDTLADPRFRDNPLVTGAPGIRFYAGMPLEAEGQPIGALCVIDTRPHDGGLDARQQFILKTLANQVSRQIALRGAVRHQAELLARHDRLESELRELNLSLETRVEARTADLLKSEEQLRQSQKMEAVGQLTGGLAHDFNNLLTGISGSLELLQTSVTQGRVTDLDRYVNAAQGATKRAAALTHRLLAFSRRQTLDSQPTDVNRLVAGMEDLLRRSVGPSIAVDVVAAGGLWPVLVDQNQLENALLNLCINARDAMPDGGHVTVETANTWLDERAARERDLSPGEYVTLRVADTGAGMAPEVAERAFDPFFTTKPLGAGTGLGLSMIYGFARQSGGQVRISSEAGQGTTMCIDLPRHYGEAELPEPPAVPAETNPNDAKLTVLVVDDEALVRMLMAELLEQFGHTVIEAGDGTAALKVLQSNARIDILITDVGLPGGMNGRQVADAARIARPDLKVLFVTGYAENAVVGSGRLDPGMRILTKPFAMDALAERIRDLIAE